MTAKTIVYLIYNEKLDGALKAIQYFEVLVTRKLQPFKVRK